MILVSPVLGRAFAVTDVGPNVVALVSHATQECLRGLLEKLTVMAEHRKAGLKVQQWKSLLLPYEWPIFMKNHHTCHSALYWWRCDKKNDYLSFYENCLFLQIQCHWKEPFLMIIINKSYCFMLIEIIQAWILSFKIVISLVVLFPAINISR